MKQHDQLVIKSGNGYVLMMIYGFSIILLGGVVFAIAEKSIVGAVLVFGLPLLLMIRYWVATGRTIKLDRYGCEVTFLGYRKKYLWEEMKYRKYENAESYRFYKTLFLESVFFSRKNIRKPIWMSPEWYCIWRHPFSTFFVYFRPKAKVRRLPVFIYCVEEDEFRQHLAEWGVEIN
ncbi:MAG: hypothetical protein IJA58_03045 [Lachnospiraceae bacterium]|nr:hypothetical protein [Lachnospiraceae bacterium]